MELFNKLHYSKDYGNESYVIQGLTVFSLNSKLSGYNR